METHFHAPGGRIHSATQRGSLTGIRVFAEGIVNSGSNSATVVQNFTPTPRATTLVFVYFAQAGDETPILRVYAKLPGMTEEALLAEAPILSNSFGAIPVDGFYDNYRFAIEGAHPQISWRLLGGQL